MIFQNFLNIQVKKKLFFILFLALVLKKIYKENGKTKIILECLGKYKDSIKEAINQYKNEFYSFVKIQNS